MAPKPSRPMAAHRCLRNAHDCRGLSIVAIRRRIVAISQAHKTAGRDSPAAAKAVRERKDALSVDLLRDAGLWLAGYGIKAKSDRPMVHLGFAMAARPSELAALDVADLRFDHRGLVVTIRRSIQDRPGGHRRRDQRAVHRERGPVWRARCASLDTAEVRLCRAHCSELSVGKLSGEPLVVSSLNNYDNTDLGLRGGEHNIEAPVAPVPRWWDEKIARMDHSAWRASGAPWYADLGISSN